MPLGGESVPPGAADVEHIAALRESPASALTSCCHQRPARHRIEIARSLRSVSGTPPSSRRQNKKNGRFVTGYSIARLSPLAILEFQFESGAVQRYDRTIAFCRNRRTAHPDQSSLAKRATPVLLPSAEAGDLMRNAAPIFPRRLSDNHQIVIAAHLLRLTALSAFHAQDDGAFDSAPVPLRAGRRVWRRGARRSGEGWG